MILKIQNLILSELHRHHPKSVGFDPTGDFQSISQSGNSKFFLYFFEHQLLANKASNKHFSFRRVVTNTVLEIPTVTSTTCRIVLNFQFMEVEEHKAVVLEHNAIVEKCLGATTLEEVKEMLMPLKNFQEFEGTTVTLQEETLNLYVRNKVTAVARRLGYTVATNKSAVITMGQDIATSPVVSLGTVLMATGSGKGSLLITAPVMGPFR